MSAEIVRFAKPRPPRAIRERAERPAGASIRDITRDLRAIARHNTRAVDVIGRLVRDVRDDYDDEGGAA